MWFAGAPAKRRKRKLDISIAYVILARALSAHILADAFFITKKKVKIGFYCRFLNISIINVPITMITTIIAAMPGSRYVSAMDACVVGCGVGVAGAGSTVNAVTACVGQ